jgi:UDP-glucose 4-epimerase
MVLTAQKTKNCEIYNLASGKEVSVNYIANIISDNKVYIPKRPGEPDRSLADISKIKSDLNWKPKIDIDAGIKMLMKNINEWKDAPVWTPESINQATKAWFKYLKKN